MKVDPFVQARLLDVAAADIELQRYAHRRNNLPEDAEVDRLTAETRACKDAAIAVEITLEDLDRDVRKLDADVDAVRKRIERDEKLLADGALPAKQQTEIEHELQTLHRRQGLLEDDELELMETRENVTSDHTARVEVLVRLEAELEEAKVLRESAVTSLEAAIAAKAAERAVLFANIPDDLAAAYERQRSTYGIGAALLRARQCGACRIEIDRGDLARIAAAPSDEVVNCPECATILVRTDESGV